ncbi:single-stranded DNA-binding protein [Blastococcus brunescens]|uniref:single-stranded DNA-binding protein n=1 Tax=Blastococcus brunescens TaxID=1564165 RepID=UPI003BEF4179
MNATEITVIGNVVTSPTRKRTQNGSVTNFRVAATERRFDSATEGWIDGHSFFVDVECWGELGGNVSHSISKGIRSSSWARSGPTSGSRSRVVAAGRRSRRRRSAPTWCAASPTSGRPRARRQPARTGRRRRPARRRRRRRRRKDWSRAGTTRTGARRWTRRPRRLLPGARARLVARAGRIGGENVRGGAANGGPTPARTTTEGSEAQWLSTSTRWSARARRTATR